MMKNEFDLSALKNDIPASIIVFLVAMPLCLGIALASGAPLFSGLIAGMVGGIVVGFLSGSSLGVSGPAAGLAVIVLNAIQDLGAYEVFLVAVVLAGIGQIIMGYLKTGVIAYYFPTSVIQGMLAGIGIIIALKQIPHAFGYDEVPEGLLEFQQADKENTFSEIFHLLDKISYGPTLIALISLAILILWETKWMKQHKVFQLIQGPLVAVIVGIILNKVFSGMGELALTTKQAVNIPVDANIQTFGDKISSFLGNFRMPDFSQFWNPKVHVTAATLMIVGSLETLLCVEASDKQDPLRRVTPTNRELKAQGVGNIISGMIGGLPITQVIIRSSVNVQAGGRTKLSAIIHGFIILFSVFLIPGLLNLIPLSTLAAILFVVGYKLARPSLFAAKWKQGQRQFVPFMATILGIVFTDLLIGIIIGFVVSIVYILYQNSLIPIIIDDERETKGHVKILLPEQVTFFKKAALLNVLAKIPKGREVTIDASKTHYIHEDVLDIIEDFKISTEARDIRVTLIELYDEKQEISPLLHFKGNVETNNLASKAPRATT